MPPHLEIRHLAALVTIAQERSLRAAAKRLGCSESTLSDRLAQLEESIGASVIVRKRGSRAGELTDSGRAILPHAEAVLDRIEAARADLSALDAAHELRVGVYGGVPLRLLPSILQRVGGLRVRPHEARDDLELLSGIRVGKLDLTFAALPLPAGPFDYLRLLEEPYVLLTRPADNKNAPGAESSSPVVAYSSSQVLRAIDRQAQSRRRDLCIVERSESDDGIRDLVVRGIGDAAILPRHSAEAGDVAIAISLEGLLPLHTTVLAWNRYRQLSDGAKQFRAAAADVFARLVSMDHER